MIILGLNPLENPSACMVRDGRLLAFCQEERFTRLKGSTGLFPSQAVSWCLKSQGLVLQAVDRIAVSWDCRKYPWEMLYQLGKMSFKVKTSQYFHESSVRSRASIFSAWDYLSQRMPGAMEQRIRDHLREEGHKGAIPKVEFVGHHVSHAYQTYYQSPFDEAAILVADGSGEENCVSGFHMKGGTLKKIFGFDIPRSLGWYYGGFTAYLGFRPNRDEGKLMGLAALGEGRRASNPWPERLEKILRVTPDGFEMDAKYFKGGGNEFHPRFTDELYKFITSFDASLGPVSVNERCESGGVVIHKYLLDQFVDLAYAVQTRLEEALASVANRLVRQTGSKNLCLAGGVAMNCKANGYILEHTPVQNMFVHPASSDDGAAIGAALHVAQQLGDNVRNILKHGQLGPFFSNDEVREALRLSSISYTAPSDVCAKAAELLARDKILGWFHGGVEMGARALGGRSIIACPLLPGMKEKVNREVKFRETWRPYCPSMVSERKEAYLNPSLEAPFMILALKATSLLAKCAPATVHVDGSVRPQTVNSDILPKWHHMLECMGTKTDHPVLLNTSLNVRSEPIVCTPQDAIRCFYSTGLDAMVIEDFLVVKPDRRID